MQTPICKAFPPIFPPRKPVCEKPEKPMAERNAEASREAVRYWGLVGENEKVAEKVQRRSASGEVGPPL